MSKESPVQKPFACENNASVVDEAANRNKKKKRKKSLAGSLSLSAWVSEEEEAAVTCFEGTRLMSWKETATRNERVPTAAYATWKREREKREFRRSLHLSGGSVVVWVGGIRDPPTREHISLSTESHNQKIVPTIISCDLETSRERRTSSSTHHHLARPDRTQLLQQQSDERRRLFSSMLQHTSWQWRQLQKMMILGFIRC
ncbi:unnamed protein product [Sphagnum jensenii]|uniref:Uncharacterized protein n=1 Tax=Sphagnum jensenii TaxID=128206 RepID=A0ABP0WLM1_9BRYO